MNKNWVNANKKLPPSGKYVLGYMKFGNHYYMDVVQHEFGKWHLRSDVPDQTILYWKSLPNKPKIKTQNKKS